MVVFSQKWYPPGTFKPYPFLLFRFTIIQTSRYHASPPHRQSRLQFSTIQSVPSSQGSQLPPSLKHPTTMLRMVPRPLKGGQGARSCFKPGIVVFPSAQASHHHAPHGPPPFEGRTVGLVPILCDGAECPFVRPLKGVARRLAL